MPTQHNEKFGKLMIFSGDPGQESQQLMDSTFTLSLNWSDELSTGSGANSQLVGPDPQRAVEPRNYRDPDTIISLFLVQFLLPQ